PQRGGGRWKKDNLQKDFYTPFQADVSSIHPGRTDFRQLINRSAANGNTSDTTEGLSWLDNFRFYNVRGNDPGAAAIVFTNHVRVLLFEDGPSYELAHSLFGSITSIFDQFETYVIFRPDDGSPEENIFVPLAKITWAWSAATTYSGGSWSLPTGSITRPHFFNNATDFPKWLQVLHN
ncbi:MAG TPA: hypothetical protein VFW05_10080, partial [Verrucomicrobiae bacterium]|nr:hypothetical protein [Verrucomicrobiae bacterium]